MAVFPGTSNPDSYLGTPEDDTIFGAAAADQLAGGDGNDVMNGNTENDYVFGARGADTVRGGAGDDGILGGGIVVKTSMADVITDIKNGTFNLAHFAPDPTDIASDRLYGDNGVDIVVSGYGNDTVNGNAGADTLVDLGGNDTLRGGADGDIIVEISQVSGGVAGNDLMFGDRGNDVLYGGRGQDTLVGGTDSDLFVFGEHKFGYGGDPALSSPVDNPDVIWDFDAVNELNAPTNAGTGWEGNNLYRGPGVSNVVSAQDYLDLEGGAGSTTNFVNTGTQAASYADARAAADLALNGTVKYAAVAFGDSSYVMWDTNADGTADASVRLVGVALTDLDASDIVDIF